MSEFSYLLKQAREEGFEKNVVGAIIENNDGKILIMQRKMDDFMGGIDELPSGNMKKGEDIEVALAREIKEETNCDMSNILFYVGSFDYKSKNGKKARQYTFAVQVDNTENISLTEHSAFSWETVDQIMENASITKEVKQMIDIYREKK